MTLFCSFPNGEGMKQIYFFAMKADLLPVLEAVERDCPLQYVRTGNSLSREFETFLRGADIPNLGTADRDTGSVCETFLVTMRTVPIAVEAFKGVGGVQRYCVDQLLNQDTVGFTPAGMWGEDVLLPGRVATVSESAISQALMKRFNSAIRAQFGKVKAFWVGRHARALLDAGKRLAISAQSPCGFGLRNGS
jgi:hypothetical protein